MTRFHDDLRATIIQDEYEMLPETQCSQCGYLFEEVTAMIQYEVDNIVAYVCVTCAAWRVRESEKEAQNE